MNWTDFVSGSFSVKQKLEKEFEWMRMYAFMYYKKFNLDNAGAEDFAQDALESFISKLKEKEELNRAYFRQLVRFRFLDRIRAEKRDALENQWTPNPAKTDETDSDSFEALPELQNEPSQNSDLVGRDLKKILESALDEFPVVHQKVILQRIIGVSAKETVKNLSRANIELTTNHVNVIYYKFKTRVKAVCIACELYPE